MISDHLPSEVLDVLLAEVGVQVVDEEAQVVQPAQPRRHVAPGDAGQQLLDGEAGHAAVGGVDVELCDGAGDGLDAPAAGQAAAASAGGESRPVQSRLAPIAKHGDIECRHLDWRWD